MESNKKRVVLVGAGHAHLYTLKRVQEFVGRGYELVLVAPSPFWYSGLATGMLGGAYSASIDQVDAAALVERGGGRFIEDEMVGLDASNRTLFLKQGAQVSFDVLSLNLGSVCKAVPGESGTDYPVKPISRLWDLRCALERCFREQPGRSVRVAIGGGGATGLEVAANIGSLASVRGGKVHVAVYVRGDTPIRLLPDAARASLMRFLSNKGISIRLNTPIERVGEGRLLLADGSEAPFDLFINATGLRPPAILSSTGLPLSADGALVVGRFLQSPASPFIFGGGDCIAFEGSSLPKVGVYAIRQAPVIFHNLLALLSGNKLKPFEPQKRFLAIMTLGEGRALAVRGSLWWKGRTAFWLKDWIDRNFLREYQVAAGQKDVA